MMKLLTIVILLLAIQKTSAQQPVGTHNFLRFDTLEIELGTIAWEDQEGYQHNCRIKNYSQDTIFCPEQITIYHDSWINPTWPRLTPLPPGKSRDIIIIAYPHRPENGGSLTKTGSLYVVNRNKNTASVREEYPITFHCTVAARRPDTAIQGNRSLIRTDK